MSGFQFIDPLKADKVLRLVDEAIEDMEWDLERFYEVRAVLERFDGKKVTKRILTAVKKIYDEEVYWVHWDGVASQNYIVVELRPQHKPKDSLLTDPRRIRIFLGYTSDPHFDLKDFDERSKSHTLDEIRKESLRKKRVFVVTMVDEYNNHLKGLQKLEKKAGDDWPLSSLFTMEYKEVRRELQKSLRE